MKTQQKESGLNNVIISICGKRNFTCFVLNFYQNLNRIQLILIYIKEN